jgi:hypothetical protein
MSVKKFTFLVPQYYENGISPMHIGDLEVEAQATTYRDDGTMRTCDILSIRWGTEDVTKYISACQPAKWDELLAAAENNFKSLFNI